MKSFGEIRYDKKHNVFGITCEPQVSLRLKRVFGRLDGSFGDHILTANEDTARDLEWFITRYPLDLSAEVRKVLTGLADANREQEQYVRDFYEGRMPTLPFELAVPAREYQKQAASMWLHVKGYLLADDVGLGKTASSIAGLTNQDLLPAVVVTLAHLPRQWQQEIEKFAPQLSTHIVKKGTPYKIGKGTLPGVESFPDVLILNYHKLSGWSETLAKFAKSVIFDEIQECRRSESQKYSAAQHLANATDYRIGLSATPIYNYGGEFFNVINLLCPGKLGTRQEFGTEWCEWGGWSDKARIKEPKAFGSYVKNAGIMLRRTRADVAREIPPVSKFTQTIDADTDALEEVHKSCAELARFILRGEEVHRGDKMRASEELSNKLRQATGIAKAPYVAAFVKILLESGEQVVLYGWHRAVYDIWKEELKEFYPAMYTGTESARQKEAAKDAFVKGNSRVLLISLRAGAGLDGLQQACKTVVFGELDWSPGVHEQAIGRVARDGQTSPVMAYFLVAETGSDPVVVDVLGVKKQQIEGVRNHDKDLFEKLVVDPNHIKRLAEDYLSRDPRSRSAEVPVHERSGDVVRN